jgi:hypothetical protein
MLASRNDLNHQVDALAHQLRQEAEEQAHRHGRELGVAVPKAA